MRRIHPPSTLIALSESHGSAARERPRFSKMCGHAPEAVETERDVSEGPRGAHSSLRDYDRNYGRRRSTLRHSLMKTSAFADPCQDKRGRRSTLRHSLMKTVQLIRGRRKKHEWIRRRSTLRHSLMKTSFLLSSTASFWICRRSTLRHSLMKTCRGAEQAIIYPSVDARPSGTA